MRRLLVLGMVAAVWAPLPTLAIDAAPMCRGETATIVGVAGQGILGTDGADVIVSNGSRFVRGGDGDDLICLTRQPDGRYSKVWGDAGDDTIRVVGGKRTFVIPGAGDDRVEGGASVEVVRIGETYDGQDPGKDDVRTGGGDDSVDLRHQGPVGHRIELGDGDDQVILRYRSRLVSPGGISGGRGVDRVSLPAFAQEDGVREVLVDNRRGVAEYDGVRQAQWDGVESFGLPTSWAQHSTFVGSGVDEEVRAAGGRGSVDIATRGGDDHVSLVHPPAAGSELDGGRGDDFFTFEDDGDVELRLGSGTVVASGPHAGGPVAFDGFDRFRASASIASLTVLGTPGPDHVRGSGRYGVRMRGGGGSDRLACLAHRRCGPMVLRGGPGADRLIGARGRDLLVGGAGRDVGNGRGGDDRCVGVEQRRSC